MLAATTVVGIDVSRDWLDGFCLPGLQRFRLANSPEGYKNLILMIRQMPARSGSALKLQGVRSGSFGRGLSQREWMPRNCLRPRSRLLPFPVEGVQKPTGLMPNSLPGSWRFVLRRDGNCRVKVCAFSER